MVKQFLFLICSLMLISNVDARTVATIGQKSIVIDRYTSCGLKKWASNQVDACGCCLTKEAVANKKSSDEVVRVCIKGKYCTLQTLANWSPGETNPDDIVANVLWNTVDSPTITVDSAFLDKTGNIKPEKFPEFLGNLKKDLRDLTEPMLTDFSKPKCLQTKSLNGGGVNTAQLFSILVNEKCIQGRPGSGAFAPKYIVKKTKKKTEEIRNLRQLHLSELRTTYDLLSRKRGKDKLAISFDMLNVKYKFKSKNHYLSFLSVAPGKSLMAVSKALGASIKKGDNAQVHRDSDILYKSFFSLGKGLGELHRHFMDIPKGKKLLRDSVVHGDLHLENVYVDPLSDYLVTLIDNESFANSLKKKRPVAVDLFVIYSFTISQFKAQYTRPKEISSTMWNNLMLKPLLLGYISNWPKNQQEQVTGELRAIFTNPKTAIKLLPQRNVFINILTYSGKTKDIKRIFDEISAK